MGCMLVPNRCTFACVLLRRSRPDLQHFCAARWRLPGPQSHVLLPPRRRSRPRWLLRVRPPGPERVSETAWLLRRCASAKSVLISSASSSLACTLRARGCHLLEGMQNILETLDIGWSGLPIPVDEQFHRHSCRISCEARIGTLGGRHPGEGRRAHLFSRKSIAVTKRSESWKSTSSSGARCDSIFRKSAHCRGRCSPSISSK